jgi:hypothetical protein
MKGVRFHAVDAREVSHESTFYPRIPKFVQ